MDYILGIDQSTQGTKALLFDNKGELICRTDLSHRQIVNGKGWVEHDGEEIYRNTVQAVKDLVEESLDYRMKQQSEDGRWPLGWSFGSGAGLHNLQIRYEAYRTLLMLVKLKRFGRIEA